MSAAKSTIKRTFGDLSDPIPSNNEHPLNKKLKSDTYLSRAPAISSITQPVQMQAISTSSIYRSTKQSLPKAVFTNAILSFLPLEDLMPLCASRVCSDWYKWAHEQLMHIASTADLIFIQEEEPVLPDTYHWNQYSAYDLIPPEAPKQCIIRRTQQDDDQRDNRGSKHKYHPCNKIDLANTGLSHMKDRVKVRCRVEFPKNLIYDVTRSNQLQICDVIKCHPSTKLTVGNHITCKVKWSDWEISLYQNDDGTWDDEEEDDLSNSFDDEPSFHSLNLSFLNMTGLWSQLIDRLRWIQLVMLTSTVDRVAFCDIIMFYRTHQRDMNQISLDELYNLVALRRSHKGYQWMNGLEELMRMCSEVPVTFWNQKFSSQEFSQIVYRDIVIDDIWKMVVGADLQDADVLLHHAKVIVNTYQAQLAATASMEAKAREKQARLDIEQTRPIHELALIARLADFGLTVSDGAYQHK